MTAHARDNRIINELHGICGARVLGLGIVVVIGLAALRIKHYVLQHCAEADSIPDLRLTLLREPDALGITSAFEVKDAIFRPAMLVIADEAARRIGRKRGLARAGEPEEQRRDAVGADV